MRKTIFISLFLVGVLGCTPPPAPNVSFESLETKGKLVHLKDLRGKVVLLDFWATWCGPCIEAKPYIEELHQKYGSKGLYVVGLTNETRATVEEFEKNQRSSYPIFLDTDNSVNITFKVEAYPTIIILGKDGQTLFRGQPSQKDEIQSILVDSLK